MDLLYRDTADTDSFNRFFTASLQIIFEESLLQLWQGDIRATVEALSLALATWRYPDSASWWQTLKDKCDQNIEATKVLSQDPTIPLNYYAAFDPICKFIDKDTYIVSEGRVGDEVEFNNKQCVHMIDL